MRRLEGKEPAWKDKEEKIYKSLQIYLLRGMDPVRDAKRQRSSSKTSSAEGGEPKKKRNKNTGPVPQRRKDPKKQADKEGDGDDNEDDGDANEDDGDANEDDGMEGEVSEGDLSRSSGGVRSNQGSPIGSNRSDSILFNSSTFTADSPNGSNSSKSSGDVFETLDPEAIHSQAKMNGPSPTQSLARKSE